MPDTTTTVAAEPSEGDAAVRAASPLKRALVWTAVVGVVAAGSFGLAASDAESTPTRGGAAARFVPADGSAYLVTDGEGARAVHENARDTGASLLLELPANAASHFFSDYSTEQISTAQLWRETVVPLDGDDATTSNLYLLDDAGLSLLTVTGGPTGFSYAPALVMLPADAAPGVRWTGEGDAMPAGLLGYTLTGEIAAGDDGCLVATTDTRYLDPATGDELLAVAETSTWCPGQGVVADEGDVGGQALSFTSEPLPAVGGYGVSGLQTRAAAPDWGDASAWRSRDLAFVFSDPAYGDSAQGLPFDGLAATTADGTLVAAVGNRLVAYDVAEGTATRSWTAAPGGDLLQLTATGEVTLVSTAERRLAAYDGRGARLWTIEFPDVVLARPAATGDGDIVALSVDGTLRRLDLSTGETVWETALRTDVDQTPAVGAGLVVLVDRGGNVIARDLDDGRERWSVELPAAERAAVGDGVVAVQGTNAEVWALDPADGGARWNAEHRGVSRELLVQAGLVISQSDEGTAAWTLDGTPAWTAAGGEGLLGDGSRVVVATDSVLEVRESDGAVVASFELGAPAIGVTRLLLPTSRGLLLLQSNTTGLEVGS
jgi:outer membrane protein assembly factor BamB